MNFDLTWTLGDFTENLHVPHRWNTCFRLIELLWYVAVFPNSVFRAFNTEDYVRASNNDGYEVVGSSCMGKISVQFISPVSTGLNSLYWPAAAAFTWT